MVPDVARTVPPPGLRRAWRLALGTFVVAAGTGVVLRLVPLVGGGLGGLRYGDVRHAHSHLMYFGWATPLLMALLADRLRAVGGSGGGRPGSGRIVLATFAAAWASYVPFLLSGYEPIDVGGASLPLSGVTATLNVAAWWWFAGWWARTSRGVPRDTAVRLLDGAVLLLLAASVGALGRGVVEALALDGPLVQRAPIHAFLDLFSDGWVLLGIVGLAWAALRPADDPPRWAVPVLIGALAPVFLVTLPRGLVLPAVRGGAAVLSVAGLAVLGLLLGRLWRAAVGRPAWRATIAFAAVRLASGLVLAVPALADWAQDGGLRILHLHVLGLGILTTGLVAAAADRGLVAARLTRAWIVAVVAVVGTVALLTDLWPAPLRGGWRLAAVAAAAVLPPVVAVLTLLWGRHPVAGSPAPAARRLEMTDRP